MRKDINLTHLPNKPGVYLMYGKKDKIIYIGKAINLKNRVKSYFHSHRQDKKVKSIVKNIEKYDYIITDTESEALILESTLIKKFKPKYNVLLKDDKELPYIRVTLKDKYPQILACRKRKKDGSKYYGPYPTMSTMYSLISFVERIFPVKYCDVPVYKDKPCLYYHLNQCLAPCIDWVSEQEHKEMIQEVCQFLEGKSKNILEKLTVDMHNAAERLDFEKAANLRDLIKSLHKYFEKQKIISQPGIDQDIIGTYFKQGVACCEVFQVRDGKLINKLNFHYQIEDKAYNESFFSTFVSEYYQKTDNIPKEIIIEKIDEDKVILEAWLKDKKGSVVKINCPQKGNKKELLNMVIKNAIHYTEKLEKDHKFLVSRNGISELQKYLSMQKKPLRIEGFDISHIQGKNTVASLVVFEEGKSKKSDYRKFKIKYSEGSPNDFASMYEVVYRRYRRVLKENLDKPDLILIDGGKGQLSSAIKALDDLNYPYENIIGLAKRLEEVILPNEKEPLILPINSYAIKLLQNIRDEAHRFAITFHRKLRSKGMKKSLLDDINGIGKARKKKLISEFGSIENMAKAKFEDLINKGKLPEKVAKNLYNKLNEN